MHVCHHSANHDTEIKLLNLFSHFTWILVKIHSVRNDTCSKHYHQFPGVKNQLKGLHFSSDMEVIAAAETWLKGQPSEFFFSSGLHKLEQRAKKYIELRGEYVE